MKKFLVFLVATIAVVCIGITFYQFAKNDEVIKVTNQTIYVNYGEKLTLEDIGFSRKEANKQTSIDFNAGGEEVTSIIKYDELSNSYIPTSKGGSTTIKIKTSNRKYSTLTIDVIVGVGSEEFPYFIGNETQLFDVTNAHVDEEVCFKLINDINITNIHQPIGLIEGNYREFKGKFNGNYHTISNLNIEACDYGGLFAILGTNSQVYSLNINGAVLDGEFAYAGVIAGKSFGTINKVTISNPTINNTKDKSNTGAVVGALETDITSVGTASILRTYAYNDNETKISAKGNLGGIAGVVTSANLHACHTKLNLNNILSLSTGGLVGILTVDETTYIRESYSLSNITAPGNAGNIIGVATLAGSVNINSINKPLTIVGLYYDNSLNNFKGIGNDYYGFETASSFAINGKTTDDMKMKDTYIYYINNSTNIVYWDKVWYIVDGSFPTLTFTTKFDDVILEDSELPTDPEDTTPDISNPSTPNPNAGIITTKEDLLNIFQKEGAVSGDYILNADIDLGGINWTPVKFSGTFKSTANHQYSISNFNVCGDDLSHVGFFYSLVNASVSNITFNGVNVVSKTAAETAGTVVGLIRGNVIIEKVNVLNSSFDLTSKYVGGIAGYVAGLTNIKTCKVNDLKTNNSASNAGGIAGYSCEDCYIFSCKVVNSYTITAANRIGGIVAVNHGTVYNSSYKGNIASGLTASAGYIGGICGVNYNLIQYCASYAELAITNNSTNLYYVGGICGYNTGNIIESSTFASNYKVSPSTGNVFIAGLTGYNSGVLKYCSADVLTIGSVNNNIYTAGLSVSNYGGKIIGCFAFADLYGYQVAGLVRTNTNNGTIDSCMVGMFETRAEYKGVQVSALVYEITSGEISNCLVNATLTSTNKDGWTAGFAGFMTYTNKKYGTISHCISNVTLAGAGRDYLAIAQDGLMKKTRTTGTITNSVISSDAKIKGVIIPEYSKFAFITQEPGSNSNYKVYGADKMKAIETYLNPTICNFDISAGIDEAKWLFVNDFATPIPKAYLTVFGYDIIGL